MTDRNYEAKRDATNDTEIYLLLKDKRAQGFYDHGKRTALTWAFTTLEKAQSFVASAKALGLQVDIEGYYRTTCDAYFKRAEQGEAAPKLVIDPEERFLEDPVFQALKNSGN